MTTAGTLPFSASFASKSGGETAKRSSYREKPPLLLAAEAGHNKVVQQLLRDPEISPNQ